MTPAAWILMLTVWAVVIAISSGLFLRVLTTPERPTPAGADEGAETADPPTATPADDGAPSGGG